MLYPIKYVLCQSVTILAFSYCRFILLLHQNRLPDWVAGELGSDVSSIPVVDSIDSPAMRFQAAQQRFTAALEDATDVDITQRYNMSLWE